MKTVLVVIALLVSIGGTAACTPLLVYDLGSAAVVGIDVAKQISMNECEPASEEPAAADATAC